MKGKISIINDKKRYVIPQNICMSVKPTNSLSFHVRVPVKHSKYFYTLQVKFRITNTCTTNICPSHFLLFLRRYNRLYNLKIFLIMYFYVHRSVFQTSLGLLKFKNF